MKSYPDVTATSKQKIFNTKLSSTRMVIERSFEKLKCSWRIRCKHCDTLLKNMIQIIQTCFILHNLCEEFNCYCIRDENMEMYQNQVQLNREDISKNGEAYRLIRDVLCNQ